VVGDGILTDDAAWHVFVDGNLAYVADRYYGIYIIDISDPGELAEVGSIEISRGKASHVFVLDGFAFVAAHSGDLQIVDVRDPSNPVHTAWMRWPGNARAVFATM
jgi:hypothetical protein